MHFSNLQLVLILAVVSAYAVSAFSGNLTQKSAILLDAERRSRIGQREAALFYWWRIPDLLGTFALIVGILKMVNVIHGRMDWGIPTMAIGFTLICLSTSLRAWLLNGAYISEAPGTPASRSAFQAAVLITVAELSLGCLVCWFVFSPRIFTHSNSTSAGAQTIAAPSPAPESPRESRDPLWVDETEALRLLKGKDAAYIQALAACKEIRSRRTNEKTEYRRDDISEQKLAGLKSMEELQLILARLKSESAPEEKSVPQTESIK